MRNITLYSCFAFLSVYFVCQACQNGETIRKAQFSTNGRTLYEARCQNCHGAEGEGLGNLYPPLTDSTFLNDHRTQLPCIVKHGLSGPISVEGRTFDTDMPPNPQLAPVEIAYLLTYIGNSFGNEMGLFTAEEITQALDTCKAPASF